MGIRFYDEALAKKIKNWVKDPNLRILKPDESGRLFEMTADLTKDKALTLPLIAISRNRDLELLNTNKYSPTFQGYKTVIKPNVLTLNAIPIQIGYQIDIYAKGMEEADEYIRNFVFNLINYPKLEITIPYNGFNVKHESNITLDASITDNSDIKEHLFADEFVRFTIKLTISDAYLFSLSETKPTELVFGELQIIDNDGNKLKNIAVEKINN